jgi:hypothetical protein
MAEETPQIDPVVEAKKIVNRYLSELGWAREFRNTVLRQLIPAIEKDVKLKNAEEMELVADEHFGADVDIWRAERSAVSKAVLKEIVEKLGKRTDLTYFGQRIMRRLKEELAS